jgi:hypothetical protein
MTHVEFLMREFAGHTRLLMMKEPSLYEVVLDHGRTMEVGKLTFGEARQIVELARWSGFRKVNDFQTKQCYMNAQKLINHHDAMGGGDELQYCEGYIAWDGAPLPIGHAWVTINGKVVDVTLRAKSKTTPHSYFGVAIAPRLLAKHQLRTGYYGPVIEGPFQLRVFPKAPRLRRARVAT